MALELGEFIPDLNENNPLGTDSKIQGNGHIQLIKKVLKNQVGSLGNNPVNATAEELNNLFTEGKLAPQFSIIQFAGEIDEIPDGWVLCDGNNGTPNLTDKFIVTSGTKFLHNSSGGNADIVLSMTEPHQLTEAEIPSHNHTAKFGKFQDAAGGIDNVNIIGRQNKMSAQLSFAVILPPLKDIASVNNSGGGGFHDHSINVSANANIPPYYALAFIMKT